MRSPVVVDEQRTVPEGEVRRTCESPTLTEITAAKEEFTSRGVEPRRFFPDIDDSRTGSSRSRSSFPVAGI